MSANTTDKKPNPSETLDGKKLIKIGLVLLAIAGFAIIVYFSSTSSSSTSSVASDSSSGTSGTSSGTSGTSSGTSGTTSGTSGTTSTTTTTPTTTTTTTPTTKTTTSTPTPTSAVGGYLKAGDNGTVSCLNYCANYGGNWGTAYSTCESAKDSSSKSVLCTDTSTSALTCMCSGPTDPIIYVGSGCTITSLPKSDGFNTYGLYFPTSTSYLHITGIPSSTYSGNWTIEFFFYTPSSTATTSPYTGALLTSSSSSTLPVTAFPSNNYISAQISSNAGKVGGTVATTQSGGGFSGAEKSYSTGTWTSVVIEYNSATTVQNYSIWVTPYGGSSSNALNLNGGATNLGAVAGGYFTTLALGSIVSNAPKGAYLTNLRVSKIARYTCSSQSTGSIPSPAIVWPGSSYTADSNTVYFNSFNIPSTSTKMGYLLSQIVQS